MAAIWSDVEFEWDELPIKVKPTLNFINKLEQVNGSSLTLLLQRIQHGDIPMGIASHVIGTTIRESGQVISNDEVYAHLLQNKVNYGTVVGIIIAACIPMPKDVKVGKPKAQKS